MLCLDKNWKCNQFIKSSMNAIFEEKIELNEKWCGKKTTKTFISDIQEDERNLTYVIINIWCVSKLFNDDKDVIVIV